MWRIRNSAAGKVSVGINATAQRGIERRLPAYYSERALGTNGSSQVVVDVQSQVEIAEDFASPAMKDQRAGAVGLNDLTHVGGKDHRAVGPLFEEFFVRPALEALVASSNHLVDQIAVKINRQRQREHEPGPHPGGIGPHWLR